MEFLTFTIYAFCLVVSSVHARMNGAMEQTVDEKYIERLVEIAFKQQRDFFTSEIEKLRRDNVMLSGRLDVLENRKPTCDCESGILENIPTKHMETDQEANTKMNNLSKGINSTLNSALKTSDSVLNEEIRGKGNEYRDKEAVEDKMKRSMPNDSLATTDFRPLSRMLTRVRRAVEENVAFSAYLDHELTHLPDGATVIFNQVFINDGNAYNPTTGVFTAHVSGVYLFAFVVDTNYINQTYHDFKLVHNGVNTVGAVTMSHSMGGNVVILRVERGQSVWLVTVGRGDNSLSAYNEFHLVTFSGFLIY